jgi:hypothetical protein
MSGTLCRRLGEMEELDSPWAGVDVETLHRVTDPDQAAILVDPSRVRFLRPFLGRECTVTKAARLVGVTPNGMLYRVRRMLDVGLLQLVREEPRAGRAVKIYRSCHDGYLVPMEAMRYDDLRHRVRSHGRLLADQMTEAYATVLATSSTEGARVLARSNTGDVWSSDLTPAVNCRGQPVHFSDVTVWLTRHEAQQVRQLLLAATQRALDATRYGSNRIPGRDPYLLVGAILPTPDT